VRRFEQRPRETAARAPAPVSAPPFPDRSRRLILLGSLVVLLGAGLLALGAAQLLLTRTLAAHLDSPAAEPGAVLAGSLSLALAGAILVWTGVGSIRRRRWVPPVMRMLGWIWLVSGVFGCAVVAALVDDLLALASRGMADLPPEVALVVKAVLLVGAVAGGVALPAAILLGYRGSSVRATCERYDPAPGWADACPERVLGLALGLGLAAAMLVPMAARPVVPWFGVLLDGWRGTAATLTLAALCAALAFAVYRRLPGAWPVTTATIVLFGVSCVATFHNVGPAELYRHLGYTETSLREIGPAGTLWEAALVWGAVVVTLLSVAFMLTVRRHFSTPGPTAGHT
jgi:hypothetical protein